MKHSFSLKPIGAKRPTRLTHADESMFKRIPVPAVVDKRIAERYKDNNKGYLGGLDAWRRNQRNAMIYLDYTKADDKPVEAEKLREYWGFIRLSTIDRIVATVRMEGLPAEYLSEDYAIRDRRRFLILKDADGLRNILNNFILALQKLDSDEWLEVEMTEELGGKSDRSRPGLKTGKARVRKVKVRDLTIQLFEKLMKMHQGESVALDPYVTPVPRRHDINIKSAVEGKSDSRVAEFHEKLKKRRLLMVPKEADNGDG